MAAKKGFLDPILKDAIIELEKEELVEPEAESVPDELIKGKPTRLTLFQSQLSRYGNRSLESARRLVITCRDTLVHIGTALAGSIILLPIIIIVRGVSVVFDVLLSSIKPLLLSLLRGIFDLLRAIIQPLYALFYGFNKQVLFPLMKRIKEDNTTAFIAFVVLIVVTVGIFLVIRGL